MAVDPTTCASCGRTFTEPAARVSVIVVCPECGASSVVDADNRTRPATAADTTALEPADLQILRKARGRIARADRRQS